MSVPTSKLEAKMTGWRIMRKQDTRQAYTKEEGAKNNMDTVETSGQKEGRAVDRVGNGK